MTTYEYSADDKAFVKECSKCKERVIATDKQECSEQVIATFFDRNRFTEDGFQNQCKKCMSHARKRRRGVEEHNVDQLFEAQQGRCALCRVQLYRPYRFPADPQGARVDHDHNTGKVRGLLCHVCNSMLGMYEAIQGNYPEFDPYQITVYLRKGQ